MGYREALRAKFDPKSQPLHGGYVDSVPAEDLRDGESPSCLNARIDGTGVSIRPGYTTWYNWGSGGAVRGVGIFYDPRNPNADKLLSYRDNVISAFDPNSAAPSPTACSGVTLYGSSRMNFLSTPGATYCMDGVNPYTKLVGTTLSQPSTGVSGLAPKKGVIFNNDLFVSGSVPVAGSGVATVSRSRYTDPVTGFPTVELVLASSNYGVGDGLTVTGVGGDNYNGTVQLTYVDNPSKTVRYIKGGTLEGTTADAGGTVTLLSGYGAADNFVYKSAATYDDFAGAGSAKYKFPEPVTGLVSGMEALFYLTKNHVHVTRVQDLTLVSGVYSYANRSVESTEGSQGFDTCVYANDRVFFLTPTNKIRVIYKSNSQIGFDTDDLTHRKINGIPNFMSSLDPDQSQGFAFFKPAESLVCWHLKSRGSAVNDVVVCYSTQYDLFEIHSAKFFFSAVEYRGRYYAASQLEAKIFQDEYAYDDDGAAIAFRYRTKQFNPQGKVRRNRFWQTEQYGLLNQLARLKITTRCDGVTVDTATVAGVASTTGGIGAFPMAETAIAGESVAEPLHEWTYVCTKGKLGKRANKLDVEYSCSEIGARASIQFFGYSWEPLPLDASRTITPPQA